MNFQAAAGDDHFLDDEPEDRLLGLECGVAEMTAELLRDLLGTHDLLRRKLAAERLGLKLGACLFDGQDSLFGRRLPRLEIEQIESAGLVGIDQSLALSVQLA